MRRTSVADLLAPFVVLAAVVYGLLRLDYGVIPPVHYGVVLPLALLAAGELIAASRVRGAVGHHPDAKPMPAIAIARCVALGKASALVGAGLAGTVTGLLARVIPDASIVRAAANDFRVGLVLLGASVLLTGAGLLLERAGIDPGRDKNGLSE
jgi:Protein of unknown function (DUF3180)